MDLITFVAESALTNESTFLLKCNCGGSILLVSPFIESSVVCPACNADIGIQITTGEPRYLLGTHRETGEPFLIFVQGNSLTHPSQLSEQERQEIIDRMIAKKDH